MITTGSVRGKWVVLQLGQRRESPASATRVGDPQSEQNLCLRCQFSSATR